MPIIITALEKGSDVVFEGGGKADITSLTKNTPVISFISEINPNNNFLLIGGDFTNVFFDPYIGITGPTNYGIGGSMTTTNSLGQVFGLIDEMTLLFPQNYVSGSLLSGTSTFENQTFNSLGMTPGTYVWSWGSEENFDTFTLQIGPAQIICIFPGALVQTPTGYQAIENLKKNDLILDEHGQEVQLINNIKCIAGHKGYVHFPKDLWGKNLPSKELTITDGHPIRPPNSKKEIAVNKLVNGHNIVRNEGYVPETYSLVTKDRIFVLVNNIPVCTWSEEKFRKYLEKEKLLYILQ